MVWNMFEVKKKDTKKTSNDVVLTSLLLTLYIVLVNSIELEQVISGCANSLKIGFFKIADM